MNSPQLAQDIAEKVQHPIVPDWLKLPQHWPAQTDLLTWCEHMGPGMAALLILLGVIYLLFGIKVFKALMMLNAAAVGAAVGFLVGQRTDMGFALMVLCGFLAAALTWPMMKWAVAVMGGMFGAALGASIWTTFGLEPQFAWSGALTGIVLFGLLSFIIFRGSITMYMSLQGSVMLVFGILGMVYKYQEVAPKITHAMTIKPFLLPMSIIIPAIIGILYQQAHAAGAPQGKK